MEEIVVAGRKIGADHEPFVIAEMSGNHNGSLERAIAIVKAAAQTGVDCLKFQTYTADTMTLDLHSDDFVIRDENSLWNGRQLHELYKEAHTPWEWHKELFDVARKHGVIAFSTPFDETAVDFLETLDVPMYKIASFELSHIPLIEKVAATGKPMIMSTGMASREDIRLAVSAARKAGAKEIAILKCTSAYPANASDANLATIPDMQEKFGVQVGLSDHTLGTGVSVASVVYGATIVEKHFTLDRNEGGVDADFSLEPWEMKLLKDETSRAWQGRGGVKYGGTTNEQKSKQFRQSVYPSSDIVAGEEFSRYNLKICRPGFSLAPRFLHDLLGKPAKRSLKIGERLTDQDI
ncbi:MAG: pseudaminic acid synthase [bacterium]|nr:pseudaminic acid synthase [bacterium]